MTAAQTPSSDKPKDLIINYSSVWPGILSRKEIDGFAIKAKPHLKWR